MKPYNIKIVINVDINIPISGARIIKEAIFIITSALMAPNPEAAMAAPAKPPISVCDDEDGIPNHQVAKFHIMAATIPEKMIGNVMYCSSTAFETVLAIPKPLKYLAMKNATKLKAAAHNTALKGVRTFVDTMVAIEFAAS